MQNLEGIVDLYLKMGTNYALMITGDWGVGKTYYFKNTLKPKISKTPLPTDNQKVYKPILVSLFGLKSVEEIQSEIFLGLYPYLKTQSIKLGASIGKAITKGILLVKGLGEYSKYVEGMEINKNTLINFEEIVICFDDLERISKSLNIEEFIGYVNSLVENENVKILIIANEGKINDDKYILLKEKVVGNSIEFIPNLSDSFESILAEKFSGFKQYKDYLEKNKELVLKVFTQKSTNLRILIFAISYFHEIFAEVLNKLFNEDNLKEKQEEILLNLLKFTIAVSIEYKEGEISFKKRNALDNPEPLFWSDFLSPINGNQLSSNNKDEPVKTYKETFIDEYFKNENFNFYNSIYDYITGGNTFDYFSLIDELKIIYHIIENQIEPQYEIYNKLGYPTCFTLTDAEYLLETKKMLNFSYKGEYDISLYMTVFHFATRFNNPLNLNIEHLEKKLINGLVKGKNKFKYNQNLDLQMHISSDSEYKQNLINIQKAALNINKDLLAESKLSEAKQLEKLCYNDFNEFSKRVLDFQSTLSFEPIFSKFNTEDFYSFFYASEPIVRWEILSFFTTRYKDASSSYLKSEIPFLKGINEKILEESSSIFGRNISGFVFKEFASCLQIAIDNLSKDLE